MGCVEFFAGIVWRRGKNSTICTHKSNENFMSQIGTLLTGAGVVTVVSGQSRCDMFLLLGDVDTANPLQGLSVEIDGVATVSIANAATLLTAFAKWQQELTASTVGVLFKVATGTIYKSTTYRFTNAGATTPVIQAFSEAPDGAPFIAATDTINALSNQTYERFSALFIQTPANIGSLEFEFTSGHRETMLIAESDARFSLYNQSEADGRLGGVSTIDNGDQSIKSVKINTNNVGACTILAAKLPDEAWKIIKKNAA